MIRKASTDDIPAIREMADVAFRHTYADILSPDQIEYMMDMMYSEESLLKQMTGADNIFYLEEGRGYVSFRHQGQDEEGRDIFHLEKLYVLPSCQKTGLGRELFNTVVREIRKVSVGDARMELNVNRNNKALTFYEHMGMRPDRQGDFPIGGGFYMNDYIMVKDI